VFKSLSLSGATDCATLALLSLLLLWLVSTLACIAMVAKQPRPRLTG
jgi:hypothetical protein